MRKIIYSIEGNIGSGKSTLLKSLMNSMSQITAIPQPVQSWQHVAGYNLLDKYYEDPTRWGYTFQVNCILSRMTQLSKSLQTMRSDKVYVSQRSVQADKFIFAKLMHKLKKISDMEYHLYLQMFDSLQGLFNKHAFSTQTHNNKFSFVKQPQSYFLQQQQQSTIQQNPQSPITYRHIYLKTSPQKCFERIKKRNRHQEQNLEYNYIKELDNLHDQWLVHTKQHNSLVLDGQREFETDGEYLNQLICQIKSYIVENSEIRDDEFFSRREQQDQKKEARQCYAK